MRRNPKLLLMSVIGWLVFLNVGWFHQWSIFTTMPRPSAEVVQWARLVTRLGDPQTLIIATVIVVICLLLFARDILAAAAMAGNMLAGWWLMDAFKSWWAIPRPLGEQMVIASDYSYPSGHSMLALAFYGFLAWYLAEKGHHRGWGLFMLLIILVVGLSRPLLNVHYPGDVIGGWGAGLGWLTLILWVYYQAVRRYEKKDV